MNIMGFEYMCVGDKSTILSTEKKYKDWPNSAQLKMKRDITRIPKKSTRSLGNTSKSYIPKHENTQTRQGKQIIKYAIMIFIRYELKKSSKEFKL